MGIKSMTEIAITRCIAPNCEQPAIPNNALCAFHRERLQRIEDDLLVGATRKIRSEMRQFERLMYTEDDVTLEGKLEHPRLLTAENIAHRMVWPIKKVRQMLHKFKDDEYRG